MAWMIILAFAVSSSIDNLAIGVTYGVRNIQIGLKQNSLMATICFLMSMMSISLGVWLSTILPGILPVIAGAFLLIVIGIRIILLAAPPPKIIINDDIYEAEKSLTGILRNPEKGDVNQSGDIGWGEAFFLGIALSANALTNGFGAGLLGFSPLAISLTAAIGSFISVKAGIKLGHKLSKVRIGKFTVGQFGVVLSGAIIIVIAITAFL